MINTKTQERIEIINTFEETDQSKRDREYLIKIKKGKINDKLYSYITKKPEWLRNTLYKLFGYSLSIEYKDNKLFYIFKKRNKIIYKGQMIQTGFSCVRGIYGK